MLKTKNIVISGTNFWNPGDDFVRDGVIRILRELFPDYILNFLFYNFNEDFFPQDKFRGIHNMVAKGDLNKYKDFIDHIVIAGLSAGNEIKDLYNWIVENNLTDRVFLIGAGYENNYAAKHITEEPELTIFKNARIITGRTKKVPGIVTELNLPYYHINCPAILSVPEVKQYSSNKKIERIAFSVQLPKGTGINNHLCAKEMYQLAIEIIPELYSEYEIEFIAHHKSEYFHFLNLFKEYNVDIPVIFSSFYQDLYELYKRYDLIITTRLHASLFANGHGIPGIILNDTDRHTHCLEGFPHSVWANNYEKFHTAFEEIKNKNLSDIAAEAKEFKENLLQKYVDVLKEPFGLGAGKSAGSVNKKPAQYEDVQTSKEKIKSEIAAIVQKGASSVEVKERVLNNFKKLEKDYWLGKNIENYQAAIDKNSNEHFDLVSFLNWYAYEFKPKSYFEIGVRRGRSMCQVVSSSPSTKIIGMDLWIKDYSTIPEKGIFTENPGPEFVQSELEKFGVINKPRLIKGDTRVELSKYFADKNNPQWFDLIVVDGDHTYKGAKSDLVQTFEHLNDGGVLVFDDIVHPSHKELQDLWNEFKEIKKDFIFIEDMTGTGTGIAIKPPFDKFLKTENKVNLSTTKTDELPVHFFTIVLNGKPFIDYHINVFKNLPFKWHWHIIEGVADLKNDTAWSLKNGAKITGDLHKNGLSIDGTTEYVDKLKNLYPANITIYRKENGAFWNGKLEMVNVPLKNINEECILWQIDSDELWTKEQLVKGRQLYLNDPAKTASYYFCVFYVGEGLLISSTDTYGNHTRFEWIRSWRYIPGDQWKSHEPPTLCRKNTAGEWDNLAKINPYMHAITQHHGLMFQHFAYVTPGQLKFKESYYGYANALSQWQNLQAQSIFPQRLADYFDWVKDEAIVEKADKFGILPLAKNEKGAWKFNYAETAKKEIKKILFLRTDAIGDSVIAASLPRYIKAKFSNCTIDVICQDHAAPVFNNSPFVDHVYGINKKQIKADTNLLNQLVIAVKDKKYDLVINSVYSADNITDLVAIGAEAEEVIGFYGDACNISREEFINNKQYYSKLIHVDAKIPELKKYELLLDALEVKHEGIFPELYIDAESEAFAEEFFQKNNLEGETTIAFFPFALHHHKEYEKYDELIRQYPGYTFLMLGGKEKQSKELAVRFSGFNNCLNLIGKTELLQMAAIIKRCRLYIGADSSAAHFACAVNTPNVVLLGGGHFGRFLPYSSNTSVVCRPMSCYNCNWKCTQPSVKCIKEISPASIIYAFEKSLNITSDKPRIFVEQETSNPISLLREYINIENYETEKINPEADIKDIEKLIAEGNYTEANNQLIQLIQLNPSNTDALNDLAVVQSLMGNNEMAEKILQNILLLDPANVLAKENLESLAAIKAQI